MFEMNSKKKGLLKNLKLTLDILGVLLIVKTIISIADCKRFCFETWPADIWFN